MIKHNSIDKNNTGRRIYNLIKKLFPICRSITGNGVHQTLKIIRQEIPGLKLHEVPSRTECFDWTVPPEWNIRDAYVMDRNGRKVIDFKKNNLHLVGYSIPINKTVSLDELQEHLHSLPDQPDAIPYVTSYYSERWGFCIAHEERVKLKPGNYKVFIDSTLEPGSLTYGEIVIPGQRSEEIFISTFICHPSLANNELSGPGVVTYLTKWILSQEKRRYTYRIVFVPETIGSIVYLSHNLEHLKKYVIAGFSISCVGDDRTYSYLPSIRGNTLADRVALHVLKHIYPNFIRYSFLDRGGDERQYCSPGVDLPVASLMRTRYGAYPEYHTSKDNLDIISPSGLFGAYNVLRHCLLCLEHNEKLKVTVTCEPQLSKRGLRSSLGAGKDFNLQARTISNLIAYSDGTRDLLEIAEIIGIKMWDLFDVVDLLKREKLLIGHF